MSVPGGSRGHFAVGADVVVAGSSATYELKVFGAGGELRHIIRNSIPSPAELRLVETGKDGPGSALRRRWATSHAGAA